MGPPDISAITRRRAKDLRINFYDREKEASQICPNRTRTESVAQ